jgi:hypothetical protein
MSKSMIAVVLIVVAVVAVIIGPILTIWALNQLFPVLAIPYTIWNWLAVVIIGAFIRAKVSISKNG